MDDDAQERQLNIHLDPEQMAGVYANFANVTFSPYEFTLTFARIDHEIEEGDVPGVVVSRVNMSQQFFQELLAAMQDLRAQRVDILTLGQYLRPSAAHLPITRYYTPDEFGELKRLGVAMGFRHVESGPLVRSSYHAWEQVERATASA